ncbi:putative tRNA nucleotidyltransferase [Vibrio phage 193E37-1]|nr:putative tRNA nucleotidyltransferase [Vibrio phage 193E37-1]
MEKNIRKVFNVGVNDSVKPTQKFEKVDGKNKLVWICPYYRKWKDMLKRCYYQKGFKTYFDCVVCDEWLTFSNFKKWCLIQGLPESLEHYHLDKDILHLNNKIYSPETCVFVKPVINTFVLDSGSARGDLPLGVNLNRSKTKFESYCRNPFIKRKQEYLGVFTTSEQAHEIWRQRKYEHACELAESEYVTDERVSKALRGRYSYENWYNLKETTNDQPK